MVLLASDAALDNQTEVRVIGLTMGLGAGWSGLPSPTEPGLVSRQFYRGSWTITARSLELFLWPSGVPVSAG